jgi:DNA-binding NarL/FixJ family response regulator
MRLSDAIVDLEDGILHIRIPFIRVLEEKKIAIAELPVKHTRREVQVLSGLLDLKANKEIACDLNLSERTVKFHVSSLLAKHKVRTRLELVGKLRNVEGERE